MRILWNIRIILDEMGSGGRKIGCVFCRMFNCFCPVFKSVSLICILDFYQ